MTIGTEGRDDSNTTDGDGWNRNRSGLRSESPSSILPNFGELELSLLELEYSGSGQNRSLLGSTVCEATLRTGTVE